MIQNHAVFYHTRSLRNSLKRGYARQAMTVAGRASADIPRLLRLARDLRPNRKAMERLARRLMSLAGVVSVRATRGGHGLVVVARTMREVEVRAEGMAVFREPGLIYLRIGITCEQGAVGFRLSAASFCRHALERLVERSSVQVAPGLLPVIDQEALCIFQGWNTGKAFEDKDGLFLPAGADGLWAGCFDTMEAETDWDLWCQGAPRVPLFSVRTFLGPDEMRPMVWLRWQDRADCAVG
jgi:hypothetical protein